jgi:ABC-type transporter Mla subunit MlaD
MFESTHQELKHILKNQERLMSALDDLTAEITKLTASVDAAITALGNSQNDTAQLTALTTQLVTVQAQLDAAVAKTVTPPTP